MRRGADDAHIRVAPSEVEPNCYVWTIRASDSQRGASAPYASATAEAARLSAECWLRELDAGPAPLLLRVLIVEDNAFYAEALRSLLTRQGYVVVGVADGADEASAIARVERPDLALVDLTLRDGRSGPDIGRRLAGNGVNVLFLTAAPDLAPAGVPGVLGVLTKPAGDARLLRAVAAARDGVSAPMATRTEPEARRGVAPRRARPVIAGFVVGAVLALMALTAWSIERAPTRVYVAIEGWAQGI